ncbi:hypothetical protein GALMADRAFT_232100 [Galerina marginata CBS 339.88]|uniref:Uncharacterized protein n=1 Tax=Galerina marginata (strain CBS 339.88) TaxID=685588 RepID=A0A067SHL5_GALM3|nr:hypothetical protein GALMADRAFT_232100 [Galerina marginata CBS 339.88]
MAIVKDLPGGVKPIIRIRAQYHYYFAVLPRTINNTEQHQHLVRSFARSSQDTAGRRQPGSGDQAEYEAQPPRVG